MEESHISDFGNMRSLDAVCGFCLRKILNINRLILSGNISETDILKLGFAPLSLITENLNIDFGTPSNHQVNNQQVAGFNAVADQCILIVTY